MSTMGAPTDTNVTMAQQQRNSVFCAIHAGMLLAGQLVSESQLNEVKSSWLVSEE
jgi:hypothetical protein